MKRFLIYLLLFPAIATVSIFAVLIILVGAYPDSLLALWHGYLMSIGPALVVALVDWFAARLGGIRGVIATTLFAYGVTVLAVVWAGTIDVWIFGFVGAIPAAVCSWLSNRSV
jgi:hypothetical protein